MKNKTTVLKNKLSALILVVTVLSSCTTKKEILYFTKQDQQDFEASNRIEKKISIDDILSVKINSLDLISSAPYNLMSNNNQALNPETLKLEGYLVDNEGTITLPVLGITKVTDKSTEELERFLMNKLINEGHLKNPTVVVRILNSKITVLGEVKMPGTYTFLEKNLTLLQAVGLAGDLTINGKRNDILLIRQEDNLKKMIHIDLTATNWFNTPYYYIKPNDVVVVHPNTAKIKSAGLVGNTTTLLSLISILLTTIVLVTK